MMSRWIVLLWGITLSLILLLIIPENDFVFRSISITLIATISIVYYLYKRYSGKLSLQTDLLIAINTLAQFLLPVFYLAFYYYENPHLDYYDFHYGYAITSFAVLVAQTMFFAGYETIKKNSYFPTIQIIEESYSKLFLVLLPLLILVWTSRIILLTTGSYYHIYRTEYQFINPLYSVFAQLSGYGLIIVGALFLIAFSEQRKRERNKKVVVAIIVFIIEMLWYLPAGTREPIAMTCSIALLAYIFIKRKLPKKAIVAFVLILFPLFTILFEYRYTVRIYQDISSINIEGLKPALLSAGDKLQKKDTNTLAFSVDRIYDGKNLGYLLTHYSQDYDYELGATYKNIIYVLIPRFIYPDKPIYTTPLGKWYQLTGKYSSTPTTFWGETYINFSWLGIIVISYILGLIMKVYDYIFIKRSSEPYWMYLYLFSAIYIMIRLPMEVGSIWISFLIKIIILAFIFTGMHSVLTKVFGKSIRFVTVPEKNI